jgi:hypothetical protein
MTAAHKTKSRREATKPAMYLVPDVAKKLKCSVQHVLNLIDEGQLPAINIGTATAKFYRIPIASYEAFENTLHLEESRSLPAGGKP